LFIVINNLSIIDTCILFIDTYFDLFHNVWPIAMPDVEHMNMNKYNTIHYAHNAMSPIRKVTLCTLCNITNNEGLPYGNKVISPIMKSYIRHIT